MLRIATRCAREAGTRKVKDDLDHEGEAGAMTFAILRAAGGSLDWRTLCHAMNRALPDCPAHLIARAQGYSLACGALTGVDVLSIDETNRHAKAVNTDVLATNAKRALTAARRVMKRAGIQP